MEEMIQTKGKLPPPRYKSPITWKYTNTLAVSKTKIHNYQQLFEF